MEDYKKKYEEALERAKAIHNLAIETSYENTRMAVEELFPELKESEDERIRKECISIINAWDKSCRLQGDCCEVAPKCIAWLEKQGKHKQHLELAEKKELKKIEQEEDSELTDFESALFSAFSDAWQEYLMGEEVNVAKWAREHSAELLEVAREQKPTWSEEDERIYNVVLELVSSWSKGTIGGCIIPPNTDRYTNWLKSLKERYTWKPSDEQMKLLREVQQALLGKDCHNRFVNFMYELKRLREEES